MRGGGLTAERFHETRVGGGVGHQTQSQEAVCCMKTRDVAIAENSVQSFL